MTGPEGPSGGWFLWLRLSDGSKLEFTFPRVKAPRTESLPPNNGIFLPRWGSIPSRTELEEKRDSHDIALGRAIRRLRKRAELSEQELADRAQVPVARLRQIENGIVDAEWGTLRHLAYALDVELADVFRLTEELEAGGES
jgi:DNA-binding XRE family transcriptional regulator